MKLNIDKIQILEDVQCRVGGVDEDIVNEYAEAMKKGDKFPDIMIFSENNKFVLADGFHRIAAKKLLKHTTIDCKVIKGDQRDATLYAIGCNATHGKRRTGADMRNAVLKLLRDPEWSKWSNMQIAKRCNVNEKTVRNIRKEFPDQNIRMGLDGNIIDYSQVGEKRKITVLRHKILSTTYIPSKTKSTPRFEDEFSGEECRKPPKAELSFWDIQPFENKVTKLVVLPDIHSVHDEVYHESARSAFRYVEETGADILVRNGDFLDFPYLSKFNKDLPLTKEGKRIQKDLDKNNIWLSWATAITPNVVDMYGNHEDRLLKYIEGNPELAGLLEIESYCRYRDKGVQMLDSACVLRVGEVSIIHGWYWGVYHARKTVDEYGGGSIYYAHTHDIQGYTKKNRTGRPVEAMSMGCLSHLSPSYKKGKPSSFVNGFGVFFIQPDGTYTRYIPVIIDGRFTDMNGKLYDGNKYDTKVTNNGRD